MFKLQPAVPELEVVGPDVIVVVLVAATGPPDVPTWVLVATTLVVGLLALTCEAGAPPGSEPGPRPFPQSSVATTMSSGKRRDPSLIASYRARLNAHSPLAQSNYLAMIALSCPYRRANCLRTRRRRAKHAPKTPATNPIEDSSGCAANAHPPREVLIGGAPEPGDAPPAPDELVEVAYDGRSAQQTNPPFESVQYAHVATAVRESTTQRTTLSPATHVAIRSLMFAPFELRGARRIWSVAHQPRRACDSHSTVGSVGQAVPTVQCNVASRTPPERCVRARAPHVR
jgi:hypothetical protein